MKTAEAIGWRTKPLDWKEVYEDPSEFITKVIGWEAECILGRYEIAFEDDGDHIVWLHGPVFSSSVDKATALSDARDAAQEDFTARIGRAIISAPCKCRLGCVN